jgi:hypothetical protein
MRANLVGAVLQGAHGYKCSFENSDLFWAELDGFDHHDCDFKAVRWPSHNKISHVARGVAPPAIKPVGLHCSPTTDELRKNIIEKYFLGGNEI